MAPTVERTLDGLDVLLAEDNPTNQLVATQMLETLGATVTLSTDGVEALDKLASATFDILLIDIEMPRLSGLEVIRQVRVPGNPHENSAAIALTAFVMPEHRAAIDEAGADGIIAKPIISIDEFGREIRSIFLEKRGTGDPQSCAGERAPAGAAAPGAPALDLAALEGLRDAIGAEGMAEILDRAQQDLAELRERLRPGTETGDLTEIRDATHILISVSGTIGAARLAARAKDANSAAHEADITALAALLPEIADLIAAAETALQDFV